MSDNNPYGTLPPNVPPPPYYGAAPKKKHRFIRFLFYSSMAFVALIVVIVVASSASKSGPSTPATEVSVGDLGGASSAAPAPAAKGGATLLMETGTGAHNSAAFTAGGDWDVHYTYDCHNFGSAGNFQIFSDGDGDANVAVNELQVRGSGVDHEYGGGTYHLMINSECDWTVKVIG